MLDEVRTKEDLLTTRRSQLVQHALAAIMLVLVLGALSMIWPVIIAVFLGVFLLLQSFGSDQELAVQSWTEAGNVSLVFSSLRRPAIPTILS
ncbi:MAG: hypothetical protein IPM58_02320 [Nitrospira sp.]|nr:hypothetical protein [Nitrospira sp.]